MTFEEILIEYGVDFRKGTQHHHSRHGWLQLDCFRCGPDSKHFRLGYNIRHHYGNCWLCGKISVVEIIKEATGLSWGKAKDLANGIAPVLQRNDVHTVRGKLQLPPGLGPLRKPHRVYLSNRGLDPDRCVQLWNVQACPPFGQYKHRLFIPIDHCGHTVSWTTRTIGGDGLRYRGAGAEEESTPAKSILYAADYARHAIAICEGPFDVWAIGPGAVCTFGTSFTRAQVLAMAAFPRRIVCFDALPDAQAKALELCKLLAPFAGETLNVELSAKDPGDADADELNELRQLLEA